MSKATFEVNKGLDAIFAAIEKKDEKKKEETKVEKPTVEVPKPEEKKKEETIVDPIPEVSKPIVVEEPKESSAYTKAKELIQLGFLKDFKIQTSEEDEEGTLISEFTDMSDENLTEIISLYKQDRKEDISTNYISKDGLKEHEVKVIEFLKNGGDFSQLASKEEDAFKRPFEGFDLDDEKRQMDILYTDLVHGKRLSHEKAIKLIDVSLKEKTLKEEAQEVFNAYRKQHSDYIDGMLSQQQKEKEIREINFKENKKALTSKYKETGLKESAYKKVISEYSKRDEKGEFLLLNKLKEILNKPEENHEVILHLIDKKIFNEAFKIKSAHQTQKEIYKLKTTSENKSNKKSTRAAAADSSAPWMIGAQKFNESINK